METWISQVISLWIIGVRKQTEQEREKTREDFTLKSVLLTCSKTKAGVRDLRKEQTKPVSYPYRELLLLFKHKETSLKITCKSIRYMAK